MPEKENENFSLMNKTKFSVQKNTFKELKNKILGKNYDLSLVIAGESLIAKLHKTHLKKDGATTIISFPLSKKSGEIFLCPAFIKKECRKYDLEFKTYLIKIYIHGILHLKGMSHGKKMEKEEEKIFKNNL